MPRPHDTPVSEWIRTLRIERGWSHDRLAAELGRGSRQTVIRWESGSQPDDDYVRRLARVLGEPEDSFRGAPVSVADRLEAIAAGVEELLQNQREMLDLLRSGQQQTRAAPKRSRNR